MNKTQSDQLKALEEWGKQLQKFHEEENEKDKAFVLSHLEVSKALVDLFNRYSYKTNKFKFGDFIDWINSVLQSKTK